MAVTDEQRNKILTGLGLEKYTSLLKRKFGSIESAVDGATTTLGELSETVAGLTPIVDVVDGLTTTVDNIEDQIDGITTTIEGLGSTYKALQTAQTITVASGSFISGLEQDEQGVVTASTSSFPIAATDTFGMVKMSASSGVTTTTVYDAPYIDGIVEAVNEAIDGVTTTIEGLGSSYKALQTATAFTAPVGSYISEISQDAQGVVTAATTSLPSVDAAAPGTAGIVEMFSGATNNLVYSKSQVDGLLAGVSGDVSGLTTTYKQLQTAVTNPVASGSTLTFISSISQDTQGVISPAAMTIPTAASGSLGVVQLASGATTATVYDKAQVDSMVAASFVASITNSIPNVADADDNTIYFIANGATTGLNIYDEYLKVNGAMEKIGTTELQLDYLSENDVETIWDETPAAE